MMVVSLTNLNLPRRFFETSSAFMRKLSGLLLLTRMVISSAFSPTSCSASRKR